MAIELSELMDEAKCLCAAGGSTAERTIMALLQRIAEGGGGGGGGVTLSVVSPEGVVTADPGELLWNSVGKELWVKETGAGNTGWWQIV